MQPIKPCLNCGQEMHGRWSHICPSCGRPFAASTGAQAATQIGVSIVVAVVVVGALVAILWWFA